MIISTLAAIHHCMSNTYYNHNLRWNQTYNTCNLVMFGFNWWQLIILNVNIEKLPQLNHHKVYFLNDWHMHTPLCIINNKWMIEIKTNCMKGVNILLLWYCFISFIIIIYIPLHISPSVHVDIYRIQYITVYTYGWCIDDVHLWYDVDLWYVYHTSFIIISILLLLLFLTMTYTVY